MSFEGSATWYETSGGGACGVDALPRYFAAINEEQFAGSAACGSCVRVTNQANQNSVELLITDLCPEQGNEMYCGPGKHHLDLGREAFAQLDDPSVGVLSISWQVVPCAVAGPIVYHFNPEAHEYWLALAVRNHRNPIAKVEARKDGAFVALQRQSWGYFTGDGFGPGPFTIRVTDVYGHELVDEGVVLSPGADVPGHAQLAACD